MKNLDFRYRNNGFSLPKTLVAVERERERENTDNKGPLVYGTLYHVHKSKKVEKRKFRSNLIEASKKDKPP